jgi:hypothetical protein
VEVSWREIMGQNLKYSPQYSHNPQNLTEKDNCGDTGDFGDGNSEFTGTPEIGRFGRKIVPLHCYRGEEPHWEHWHENLTDLPWLALRISRFPMRLQPAVAAEYSRRYLAALTNVTDQPILRVNIARRKANIWLRQLTVDDARKLEK